MLYHAYDAHRDILAPFRLFAETAHSLLDPRWLGGSAFLRSAAAALNMFSNGGIRHERPDFGIRPRDGRRHRDRGDRGSRRDRPVLPARAFPQGGGARTAEAAGRCAAFRAFRDVAARHRRHCPARPRCLCDRLGQRAQRAGAIRPFRPRRRDRAARSSTFGCSAPAVTFWRYASLPCRSWRRCR